MTYRDSNARTETRSGNHSNGRDDGRNCPVRPQLVNCDDSTCGRSVNRKESVKTFEGNISRDCCGSIEQSERRNSDNGSGRESIVFPSLEIINGKPTTTSLQVAEYFGKRHDNVIRDIKNILEKRPDLRLLNFEETQQLVKVGAVERHIVVYRMDRKGFTLLAMGFTGEPALKFKIAYIDAFDAMEAKLRGDSLPQGNTLTPAQQLAIQQAVGRRAQKTANHYQTIYRAIKLRYQIARYDQLPQSLFEDCLNFIKTLDLRVPEQPKPAVPNHPVFDENGCCPYCGLKPIPEGAKILTKEHQRALYAKIKPLLDDAEQSMRIIEQERCHAWTCYHELRLLLIGIC